MTFAESLAYCSFLAQVTANVLVAVYVFPLWRKRRLRFFALFGLSALIGAFIAVANWTFGRQPMSEQDRYWFWCATHILSIADYALITAAFVLMVRHFQTPHSGSD